MKNIRKKYLLKLVESDPENFTEELLLDDARTLVVDKEKRINNILNISIFY